MENYWIAIAGLLFWSALTGLIALKRNKNFWFYFMMSLVFTPLIMMIFALCDLKKDAENSRFYSHPFSVAYWRQAAREITSVRMLVFAAMMVALRIIFKQISIPIGPNLRINTAFIINALGAMVMGPVLSLLCAAVTDTLGAFLFPQGPYFFPFIFVEMAGSLIFALFLYRTKLKPWRLIASRFCICFLVNIVINTPIMMIYYEMVLGKAYPVLNLPRIAKNLVAFPLEALVLMLVFRPLLPALRRMGFAVDAPDGIRPTKKTVAVAVALALLGGVAVGGYVWYDYENTSLSASYTAEQRLSRNEALGRIVLERHPELREEETVCVIESAYPRAFSPEVTYHVAVYRADLTGAEDPAALLTELRGLSKSKAAARSELTRLFDEDLVLTEYGLEPEKRP